MSTLMFTNYYDVLGIPTQAPIEDIKVAWKRLALKYHPDKSRGAETNEIFQKVSHNHRPLDALGGH